MRWDYSLLDITHHHHDFINIIIIIVIFPFTIRLLILYDSRIFWISTMTLPCFFWKWKWTPNILRASDANSSDLNHRLPHGPLSVNQYQQFQIWKNVWISSITIWKIVYHSKRFHDRLRVFSKKNRVSSL